MNIKSIAHICIGTADLEATLRFYSVLGLQKVFDFTRKGRVIGYYLRVSGNSFIEIFEKADAAAAPGGAQAHLAHLCLETEDIEGLRKKLIDAGYEPGGITLACDQTYQCWVKDPDGTGVEFHQYTPRSAQLTGESVEVPW